MNHPQRTHKLYTGQYIHHWIVLRRLPYKPKEASNKRLQVHCQCRACGKTENVPEYYILRPHSPKKHCGCLRKSIITDNPWEYRVWYMMHVRCYDPRHRFYKYYGGRSISICPEWHKDNPDGKGFERFLEYMGKRPSLKFSIDRIDNNDGYKPFQKDGVTRQCRWATAEQQRANQRTPAQMSTSAAS